MKFKTYLKENTGMGADGLSKQRLKTLIHKETKKCWYNKVWKDKYWAGPNCIWDTFNKLDLNWGTTKAEYQHDKGETMPVRKVWQFTIKWDDNKGKFKELKGHLTAAGCGSVSNPLERYDLVLQVY